MLSTSADKEEIFKKVKSSFSDYALFDRLVATKLREAIRDTEYIEINAKTTEKVAERYFDVKSFKTPEQKLALTQIELIFKTSYILILSHKEENKALLWMDTKTLLNSYPDFASADTHEMHLLLRYRNACRIALTVIPARRNKALIMKIAERLEGSQKDYITGGGQSMEVKRRVQIYEKEGNIQAEKRPPRERRCKDKNAEKTSHIATFSVKRAKQVRLQTEDLSLLAKDPTDAFLENTADPDDSSAPPTKKPTPAPAPAVNLAAPKPRPVKHNVTEVIWSPLNALSFVASSLPLAPEMVEPKPSTTQPAAAPTTVTATAAADKAATAVAVPASASSVSSTTNSAAPAATSASAGPALSFPAMRGASQEWSGNSLESSLGSGYHPAYAGLTDPSTHWSSMMLQASDPEFWKQAHDSAVASAAVAGGGVRAPGYPLSALSYDVSAFNTASTPMVEPLRGGNGKTGKAKRAAAAAAAAQPAFESSLGLYSNYLPPDMQAALHRTAFPMQPPMFYPPYAAYPPPGAVDMELLYATATASQHPGYPMIPGAMSMPSYNLGTAPAPANTGTGKKTGGRSGKKATAVSTA